MHRKELHCNGNAVMPEYQIREEEGTKPPSDAQCISVHSVEIAENGNMKSSQFHRLPPFPARGNSDLRLEEIDTSGFSRGSG